LRVSGVGPNGQVISDTLNINLRR